MKEIDDAPTAGAGYSEEEIDNASGVARTSTAALGYDPADGTYTAPKKKYAQTRFTPLPTNTGNRLLDEANAQQNRIDAKLFTDPRLASLTNLFDERYGGHGFSDYRDTMDDYMLHEFGRSKYDEGATNVLTSEDAKRNRAENQSALMAVVNGGARFVNRAAGTVAAGVAGIVDALASPILQQAGVSLKDYGWDAESVANRTEAGSEWLNKEIPLYQSQEDEQYAQEHPFKGAFLTRQGWANFIDNLGFTAGAAATAYGLAYTGAPIAAGIGAATLAKTVQDYIASDGDMTAKDLLPLATGIAGTVLTKAVPLSSAMKTQIATLSASIISSFGEGNIEAVNAKNDFISGKSSVIDQDVAQRKQLVMREMESRLVQEKKDETAQLVKEGKMTEADALMEALRRAREAKGTREWQEQVANQMAILDWEGTRVKNRITREAESVADLTRLLNVGLLSASNMIQFGKVFNGGYKTYRTMRRVEAAKDATEAADKAYKAALRNARTSVERAGVRARRDAIRVEAMRRWADETGGKLFDEGKRLTRGDYFDIIVKNPATEGLEEVGQSMVSAGAMGASEWGVDDYYSQISGVDAYRKADSAVMAGIKSAAGKLTEAETWVEFVSGALTGALGMPGVRTPFKRDAAAAEPKDDREAARRFRLRNLQSPIFMRGGIWGEARKAKSDREAMARMAGRLNEAMTDKQLEAFRKQMGHIARHMQYEDDKRMWADGDGDKFNFENAVDADLLNSIELFQNSGNLDLLRGMAQSMLDVKTTDDLLALQSLTETDDGKGGKTGPYSEFKITNLGKDATEEQRKASEEQERLMREKIARDVKRQVRAIDAYAKARQELDFETRQGLSDDQLNCLTWYKVRLSMFDDRSKEMFDDIEDDLKTIFNNFKDIEDDVAARFDNDISNIEKVVRENGGDKELAFPNGQKITTKEYLEYVKRNKDAALKGLAAVKDALTKGKTRALFEAKEAPVDKSGRPLKKLSRTQEARAERVDKKRIGLNVIASGLQNSKVFASIFSDESRRNDLASKIRDIRNAQDAIERYDALYKLYKAHPGLMAQRKREHEEEIRQEAVSEEKAQAKEGLAACKTKAELYATIEKMIDDGKDADVINAAIDELIKSGSALAKEFYENQKYVRYFANALTRVVDNRVGFAKETDAKTRSMIPLILQQLMLDAAENCAGCKAMREYVMAKINGELSTPEGFIAYLNRKGLLEKPDSMTVEELNENMNIFLLDDKGKHVPNGKMPNGRVKNKSVAKTKFSMLHDALPILFNAANNVLLRDAKRRMSLNLPNVDVSDFDLMTLRGSVNRNYTPYDNKAYDKVEKIARVGSKETFDNDKGADETKEAEKKSNENDEVVAEEESVEEEGVERKKVDEKDVVRFGQEGDKSEGKDGPAEKQNEEAPNAKEVPIKGEVTNGSKDDGGAAERLLKQDGDKIEASDVEWRPAVSFFNIELRKTGKFIRNFLVSLFGGAHVAKDGEKRHFEKFFNMLEKLGAFRFTDDTPNAVTVGEPVYFIVDKMKGGKSEIFRLKDNEITYDGAPIVFMCVKRGDGYQCVGTMHTSQSALKRNGQLDFYNAVVENAKKSEGAYVHKDANGDAITMPVKKFIPGFVQTSDSEHAILDVIGGKVNADKAVFAIYTGNGVCFGGGGDVRHMKAEDLLDGKKDMAVGRLHLLVKDNATGKYRPMPCRIARYGKDDEALYRRKGQANAIDEIVGRMSELARQYAELVAKGKSANEITNRFNDEYKGLSNILAMKGYGLHMDIEVKDGIPKIRFSQIVYKDGKPVVLKRTDKLKVNGISWEDKNETERIKGAELEYDKESRYLRKFIYVDANPNAVVNTLKSFNLQFRVRLKNGFINNDDLSALVSQGVITTNIEPGCGVHTYGTSVVVDASSVNKSEQIDTKPKDTDSASLHGDERYVTILGEQFRLRGKRIFTFDGKEIKHYPTIRGIRHYVDTPEECRVIDLSTRVNDSDQTVYCLWSTKNEDSAGVRCRLYRNANGQLEFDMLDNKRQTDTQYISLKMLQISNEFIHLMIVYDLYGFSALRSLNLKTGYFVNVCKTANDIFNHLVSFDYNDDALIESMLDELDEQDSSSFKKACGLFKNWLYCLRKTDEEKASKLIIKLLSEFHSHDEAAAIGQTLRKNIWHYKEADVADDAISQGEQDVVEPVVAEGKSEDAESVEGDVAPNGATENETVVMKGKDEIAEDTVEDDTVDTAEDIAEDVAANISEDATEDTMENSTEDAAENVEDIAEEDAIEEGEVAEDDIADEAIEEEAEDTTSDIEEDVAEDMEEEAEDSVSDIEEDNTGNVANEAMGATQEDAIKGVTEEETEEGATEEVGAPATHEKVPDVSKKDIEEVAEAVADKVAPNGMASEAITKKDKSEYVKAKRAELSRINLMVLAKKIQDPTKNTTSPGNYTKKFTLSIRRKGDEAKPKIDINKELEVIRKRLPWLERENAIVVYEHLMTVGQNGMKAQGMYTHGIVSLSHEACRGTGFHEAFHAVFRTSLTDENRKEIYDAMRRDYGYENPIEAEEFLADEFAKFMVDRVYGTNLIKRVKDFFTHLWCIIRGGRRSRIIMDDLFHKINDGGFATRDINYDHHIVERRKWWLHVGHKDKDWILNREDYLTSFAARSPQIQSMLEEAGWTEESFDNLTQEQREKAVRCL